jgi:hypothetical protein
MVIPPHEGFMLQNSWMGYRENIYKCSRGTSKTFTVGSLFAPMDALLHRNRNILVASASKFRGGKRVLKDTERLVGGQLSGQRLEKQWVRKSISHVGAIKREPDMHSIDFKSFSSVFTVPTSNEESIRGIRANVMILDERNTFEGEAIQRVFLPFLAVGSDFENPAAGAENNQVFSVGTIDYSYRDWFKEIAAAKDLAQLQYAAHRAMNKGDWDTYDDIMAKHGRRLRNLSLSFVRFDYTDLLIPTRIGNYDVYYPGALPGKHIKWDDRDEQEYVYTYPVNKKQLETPLDEGIIDKESWEAEQRNMFISASGSVYPPALVEKVTGPIFTRAEEVKRGWDAKKVESRYFPPVLYKCTDPCVLGVDTARTADFTAFVIIRLGEAPEEYFVEKRAGYDLKAHMGPSPWANVIWAEQHHHLTTKETSEIIRRYRERYNIVATRTIPGMVMDAKGGGVHVRDELANPSPPVTEEGVPVSNWKRPQRIFDPEDDEFKHLLGDEDAWFGLRLINTTDIINQELISFSRAQMEVGRMYIGAYKPQSERKRSEDLYALGYLGVRTLKHQLLRIQAVPTASGKSVRFDMPGDPRKLENKKDLLMAFLYACYGVREVYTYLTKQVASAPVAYGEVLQL